ncbi:MAG TPA: hypothetical protein VLA74_02580 [Nitrososphaeraceae archaeon]|nr:hypothetical protein [Nitrososphaeraceae archaeon]
MITKDDRKHSAITIFHYHDIPIPRISLLLGSSATQSNINLESTLICVSSTINLDIFILL